MPPNNQIPGQSMAPTNPPTPTDGAVFGMPQPQVQTPQPTPTGSKKNAQPPAKKPHNPNSTQNTLLFSEIRDEMIVMKDGSFRAVVACQSINFDLMSQQEREGVELSYQGFLNSLSFPIQIFIRSERVDIEPYIEKLLELRRNQDNMLLGVLMDGYIDFIDGLAEEANIMDKSFFIVIPYFTQGDGENIIETSKSLFATIFSNPNSNNVTKIDKTTYEKAQTEVKHRVELVLSGLNQVGVRGVQLNTKELGELMYNVYNPDTAIRQPLGDFENTANIFVKKGNPQDQNTGSIR